MGKDKTLLDMNMPEIEPTPENKPDKKGGKSAKSKKKKNRRNAIGKFFRDIVSELKKVSWPSFKKGKDNSGVLGQTGSVIVVTMFFMIVIGLVDAGLAELLKLILNAAK